MDLLEKLRIEREEGWQEGIIEGKKEGIIEGKKEGIIEGKKEGKKEEKRSVLRSLRKKMSAEEIAGLLELSLDEVISLTTE